MQTAVSIVLNGSLPCKAVVHCVGSDDGVLISVSQPGTFEFLLCQNKISFHA